MFDLNFIMKVVNYIHWINMMDTNPSLWNKYKVQTVGNSKHDNKFDEMTLTHFKVDLTDKYLQYYMAYVCCYFHLKNFKY